MQWDGTILYWMASWAGQSSGGDFIIRFLASTLPYLVAFAALIVLLIPTDREHRLHISRKMVLLFALVSAGIARFVLTPLIRSMFPRTRPFETIAQIHALISHETGGSFPSGHAVFFFSLATTVWLHNKKLGSIFYGLALLNGLARISAGVHWPSDIAAGAAIGVIVGILADRVLHVWHPRASH